MSSSPIFRGLSAFPITPTDAGGRVDTELLGRLLDRLCHAGVDSIGLLGSTGIYAYLMPEERQRAVAAAIECVSGRVPLIVGVGALRTDDAVALARHAATSGADALLIAPMSYTPLTDDEVHAHYLAVASAAELPLCVYDNPDTTHFRFGVDLLERLARIGTVQAVKLPLPKDGGVSAELAILRQRTTLSVGYSGDPGLVAAMLDGADAFYSVLAGTLPAPAVAAMRAVRSGQTEDAWRLDAALAPLWQTFQAHGSIRVMYALVALLGLGQVTPPRPILPLGPAARQQVERALENL